LFRFWKIRGYASEARSWYKKVAERIALLVEQTIDKTGDGHERNEYGVPSGAAQPRRGGVHPASVARRLSPELPVLWGRVLSGAGNMALEQADYEEARSYHGQSLALSREIAAKHGITASLPDLGTVAEHK